MQIAKKNRHGLQMRRRRERRRIRHINSNAFMNIYCEIYPFLDINIAIIKQGTKIVAYSTYSCTNKTL